MPDEPDVTDLQTDSLSRFYQVRGEVITDTKNENIFDYVTLIHKLMFRFDDLGPLLINPESFAFIQKNPKLEATVLKLPWIDVGYLEIMDGNPFFGGRRR